MILGHFILISGRHLIGDCCEYRDAKTVFNHISSNCGSMVNLLISVHIPSVRKSFFFASNARNNSAWCWLFQDFLCWIHLQMACLFDLSPVCFNKCVLKFPAWLDVKSHWLHDCTLMAFLRHEFLNAPSKHLDQNTITYTDNICLTFLHGQMSSQINTFLGWLFTLCASVRLLPTVSENMVLQNSISTNDFSYSVLGWGFSPICA